MNPGEFIAKWRASELKERSAAQEHFIDLCRLPGEPTPAEADPVGEHYCFERGVLKDTGLVDTFSFKVRICAQDFLG